MMSVIAPSKTRQAKRGCADAKELLMANDRRPELPEQEVF